MTADRRMERGAPTMGELNALSRILRKAKHRNVADALLKGFMWACSPEWYERNKWECYKELSELRERGA
jgi:hypothetical protein